VTSSVATGSIQFTTTQQPIIVTTTGSSPSPSNQNCPNGDGLYPDKTTGCQKYFECIFQGTSYASVVIRECPPFTIFDVKIGACNWAQFTTC
jgi:hypothetical protein